jgi:hypothetical protein
MREDPQVSINISREVFSSDFPDDNYPERRSATWAREPAQPQRYPLMIGIGAAVTRRPLPHNRAYGSVHGGSRWLR